MTKGTNALFSQDSKDRIALRTLNLNHHPKLFIKERPNGLFMAATADLARPILRIAVILFGARINTE